MDFFSFIGTIALTIPGYLVGAKKRLNVLGITILSFMIAISGVAMKNVIISRVLAAFLDIQTNLVIISILLLSVILWLHYKNYTLLRRLLVTANTISLAAFSMTVLRSDLPII